MKAFLANSIVKWYKSCGVFGLFRFRLLYLVYRLWPGLHIRQDEWDFVLPYLPKLHNQQQRVQVLDVGTSRNLLAYELVHRGYMLTGLDLEEYQEEYPGHDFFRLDITEMSFNSKFDFITCISVLEHIGNDGKGDIEDQEKALHNMVKSLKVGGRLLLTTATEEFAQGHIWHGFQYSIIQLMLPENANIIQYAEKAGQVCFAIERVS